MHNVILGMGDGSEVRCLPYSMSKNRPLRWLSSKGTYCQGLWPRFNPWVLWEATLTTTCYADLHSMWSRSMHPHPHSHPHKARDGVHTCNPIWGWRKADPQSSLDSYRSNENFRYSVTKMYGWRMLRKPLGMTSGCHKHAYTSPSTHQLVYSII